MNHQLLNFVRRNPRASGAAAVVVVGIVGGFFVFQGGSSPRASMADAAKGPQTRMVGKNLPTMDATVGQAALEDLTARIAKAASGEEFSQLMREVMALPDPDLRSKAAVALVRRWVSVDLKGFIAFVDTTEVSDDGADALWALLAPALANALPGLDEAVLSNPDLNEVVRRLIEYSARKDPDQALAWANQWLLDDARESALATIAGEMIRQSPEKALAVFAEIQTSVRRVDAIEAIAAVYGTTHPEEATDWARSLPILAERPYAMDAVLAARAEVGPADAATEFTAFRGKMETAYAAERAAAIARMGAKDIQNESGQPLTPEEAMDSETLPGREDPQIALLDEAAVAIAENWGAAEPAEAMRWSQSLAAGRLRDAAITGVYRGWASQQPEAAFQDYIKNNASNADPAQPIFEAWAQADPVHAAEQSNKLTDPALREQAINGVVSGWLDNGGDQSVLMAWVSQLPRKQEQDAANAQIAEATSYESPDIAWQRATLIQNQGTRKEALKSAFASMVEANPDQAKVALAQATNLTPDETNRLNKMLRAVTSTSSN